MGFARRRRLAATPHPHRFSQVLPAVLRGEGVTTNDKSDRLLRALGHDPRLFAAVRMNHGLRVITRDGMKPVRFYTLKALRTKGKDPAFLRVWEAAG